MYGRAERKSKMRTIPSNQISAPGLIKYLKNLNKEIIGCEIGVLNGYNLYNILSQVENIKKVYAIDPWVEYQDWNNYITNSSIQNSKKNAFEILNDFNKKVCIIEKFSHEAYYEIEDDELDFIFIDGNHSYKAVLEDLNNFYKKIKSGGIISGHDFQLFEVKKAVVEFREKNKIKNELLFTDHNVWMWYKK